MKEKILELVMIVKNSGEVLRDCLKVNKQFIDYWTILDTGSSDNTPEIIREELKDIPGELHFGEFVDFSQARNKSLELSSKKCKYTIILDDSYAIHDGEQLRKILQKGKKSCYLIKIGKFVDNFLRDGYYSKRIIKSSEELKYKYRVHEDIQVDEKNIETITNVNIFLNDKDSKSHTKRSFSRFEKDIEMLLMDYEDYPEDQRVIYYISKTYELLENYDKAIIFYNKLKNLNNVREDFLFSAYYNSACVNYYLNDNLKSFKANLISIQNLFKNRVEASYKLAVIYRDEGDIHKVNDIISKIILYPKPVFTGTILEMDIYDYYIPYMYIDINLVLGNIDKAVLVLKKLLEIYPNDQPLLNIKYNVCDNLNISSIELSDNKTIVIHTSGPIDIIYCWNPRGDKRISGSEYMAMNLGKEFLKLGYRVFIIGTFEDIEKNINYEGIYDGIEYIDYKYFSEFALKYVIDYLIVSRFTSNLVYYNNIKKVYLWIHDVLPVIDEKSNCVQYHKEKFKGIIAISEWQKENTVKKLNIPSSNIIISRNAIYSERFLNKDVKKIPYRFIYSSCPERGLKYLIQIIPKIKERYKETTLYLFVNNKLIDSNTYDAIKKLDYVYLHDRISQTELAIEFLKSDIWLYPTDFKETYCITALEAMISNCLIATVNYAALTEMVTGKGILCESPVKDNINDLIEKLFFVLERPSLKSYFIEKAYEWAIEQTYDKLAEEWVDHIFTL
jgi:tetratricopeptide (TPR) repeat protein